MAESTTPSGDEQLLIIKMLLHEQSNCRKQPDKTEPDKTEPDKPKSDKPSTDNPETDKPSTPSDGRNGHEDLLDIHEDEEENQYYMVSTSWIYKWLHHVKHFHKAVYPGKLTMVTSDLSDIPDFEHLDGMNSEHDWSTNKWVPETVWCKLVQWYGVEDGHGLDRYPNNDRELDWEELGISLKGDLGAHLAAASKYFYQTEKCGYMELQLRRIFGVTHDTETQLWLDGKTPILLDRSKELRHYADPEEDLSNCTLQFEICPPSEDKGATDNHFDMYVHLTGRPRIKGDDKAVAFKTTVDGFSKTLQDTMGSVVELEAMIKDVSKTQKEFDEKIRVAIKKEKELHSKEVQLQNEKDQFQKEMQREKEQLQQEIQCMSEVNQICETRIKLDIGGHVYATSVLTLTRDPQSMLATMFSGRHSVKKEEDGSYFIDRDGTHFRYILNYLRDGGFKDGLLPGDILMELQTEAEYYQLSGLVALLRRDGSTTT